MCNVSVSDCNINFSEQLRHAEITEGRKLCHQFPQQLWRRSCVLILFYWMIKNDYLLNFIKPKQRCGNWYASIHLQIFILFLTIFLILFFTAYLELCNLIWWKAWNATADSEAAVFRAVGCLHELAMSPPFIHASCKTNDCCIRDCQGGRREVKVIF